MSQDVRTAVHKRISGVVFLSLALWVAAATSYAYILPADSILKYSLKNRPEFSGLEVRQVVEFQDTRFPEGKMPTRETLYLQRGGEFRVDGKYTKFERTWIEQKGMSLVLTDGVPSQEGRVRASLLRDLFLVGEPEILKAGLLAASVNPNLVSLGRMDKLVVQIIGAREGDLTQPQVWFAKDTFLPVRAILYEEIDGKRQRLDFRFQQFGKNTPSWYPARTEIYLDETRIATVQVEQALIRASFPAAVFDLEAVRKKFPQARPAQGDSLVASTRFGETFTRLRKQF